AMSRTHNLLADSGWKPLELSMLINHLLNSAGDVVPNAIEVHIEGPTTPISPRQSVPLAMSIIELFTNSCKHGAHRSPRGRLEISWSHSRRQERTWVSLHWRERGGQSIDKLVCPSLGSELVQGFVNFELGGRCDLKFPPEGADHRLEFIIEDATE